MQKLFTIAAAITLAAPAFAHPGHVEEAAGHTHWLAVAAAGAAIVIGLWFGVRRRRANRLDSEKTRQKV